MLRAQKRWEFSPKKLSFKKYIFGGRNIPPYLLYKKEGKNLYRKYCCFFLLSKREILGKSSRLRKSHCHGTIVYSTIVRIVLTLLILSLRRDETVRDRGSGMIYASKHYYDVLLSIKLSRFIHLMHAARECTARSHLYKKKRRHNCSSENYEAAFAVLFGWRSKPKEPWERPVRPGPFYTDHQTFSSNTWTSQRAQQRNFPLKKNSF